MSLLSDTPRVLSIHHTLTSSSWAGQNGGNPATQQGKAPGGNEDQQVSAGVLHVAFAPGHQGRDDVVPTPQRMSIVLSRGQIEAMALQLKRMLGRVGGSDDSNAAGTSS